MVEIEHVIVLALENRSFDHMLGFLQHPDPQFDGLRGDGRYENPGWQGGPSVPAEPAAKAVIPVGPDHSYDGVMEQLAIRGIGPARRPTNQGFVTSYERICRGLVSPKFGGLLGPLLNWWAQRKANSHAAIQSRGPLVMHCQPPENVPVISTLALEFAVCTRWFCSVPGETWPNRNFLHAATSDGETNIELRPYTDRTIFELLEEDYGREWHIYHDDTPQVWAFPRLWDRADRHARWFPLEEFARHVETGQLPAYSFLEPNHRPPLHTLDRTPVVGAPGLSNSQHPENNLVSDTSYDNFVPGDTDFARAESLVANIYETLRAHPEVFERSLLLISYDEHGGFYDHVPPPTGIPSPGDPPNLLGRLLSSLMYRKSASFDFTMLGPRVPAVIISPYITAGRVDDTVRDHTSVPATLRALFAPDAAPLTRRDAWSPPFHTVLDRDQPRRGRELPDLSPYVSRRPAEVPFAALSAHDEGTREADIPQYYRDFAAQAEYVEEHLRAVGEPEVSRRI
ncbi:MAG: alkaline phosphatase family protein, partial [Actinomycetota bacterium]|nr:alkaline phosphatase family protein [Actinomycetota bacterium]